MLELLNTKIFDNERNILNADLFVNNLKHTFKAFKFNTKITYEVYRNITIYHITWNDDKSYEDMLELKKEIALALGVTTNEFEIEKEKENEVKIKVQNMKKSTLSLKELLEESKDKDNNNIPLGLSEEDKVIYFNIEKDKNLLVTGVTGIGKTNLFNNIILNILMNKDKTKIIILDSQSINYNAYDKLCEVVNDEQEIINKIKEIRHIFEEKVKNNDQSRIILFIDEIHTIVGAGAAEGAIDASNILKPLLARGEMQLIGATTLKEYKKYIERDSALERRFSPVTVNEPSEKDTVQILKGIRDKYEAHHNVKITDEAIEAAVKLSVRYVNDRFLPDKAIDLIDEASSKARLRSYTEPESLKELQEKIEKMKNEKEDAVINQKFEKAAELRDKEKSLKEQFEKEQTKWNNKKTKDIVTITEENIAEVISSWTGIPAKKITEDENEKLKNLEVELHKRVIGQNEAVEAVSKAIRRGRVGLKDPKRPIGSFLFLGPTGVGKTELAKALAEALFGNENSMIRVDMSEFMEPHSVAKLIGAPPGYVGYDEGGQLTEKIRRRPYSVILFDEVEKAHPDVMNMLLQILEDGRLTDAQGRTVNFKNTVIIMTSNVGAKLITDKNKLGFAGGNAEENKNQEYETIKKEVMGELKKQFRPELINRIDDIIVFHKLEDEDIKKIIDIMLVQVQNRLSAQNIKIDIDQSVKDLIAKKGVDTNYGARPLRRAIQNMLEDKIAEAILDGVIKPKKKAKAVVKDDKIVIE